MDSNCTIRPAKREDIPHIWKMILEFAEFEKMRGKPAISQEILMKDLFDTTPPSFQCLVAEATEDNFKWLFGFSIFFPIYSSWKGKSMMLESIFIKPNYRLIGAGKKMLSAIAKISLDAGCHRIDFHVLKWETARKFYELLGAVDLTERDGWLLFRLEHKAMVNCANNGLKPFS